MTAQNMAKKILADSGYEVTTVSNGAAAVKKIAEVKPDLVILDIYMPGYTGLEVCERVRANLDTTNLPVLLTVGKMEPYRPEDGARVRADGIIVKPFEATDLLNIVRKISDKFAPAKKANYGEIEETVAIPAPQPVEDFKDASYEDWKTSTRVDVPAEMAIAPAMSFEDHGSNNGDAPIAMEWAPSTSATEPQAVSGALPVEPFEAPASPVSFVPAKAETNDGTITDSMPAYVEPEASAPTFELETNQPVHAETSAVAAPEPEIEFNSVPQSADGDIERVAGLEPTISNEEISVNTSADPALVTDPNELSKFTTSFGVENAEEIPVGTVTGNEAFLAETSGQDMPEPLAAEHVFPTASLESMEIAEEPAAAEEPVESHSFAANIEPVEAEVEHDEVEPEPAPAASKDAVDDFEARVAAAMSAFDQPLESSVVEEPVVEQVDNFIGDPEVPNPVSVDHEPEPEPAPIVAESSAWSQPEPEPVPVVESRRSLDVNETMVLPAEAMLSLEAEMRKAMELKQAAMPPEPPPPTHEQVMDTFTGSAKQESEPSPEKTQAIAPLEDTAEVEPSRDHEFASALRAALHETHPEPVHQSEPEHVEPPAHEVAPALAMAAAAAIPAMETWGNNHSDDKLASAVQRAMDRLKPQIIAEIVKALKDE